MKILKLLRFKKYGALKRLLLLFLLVLAAFAVFLQIVWFYNNFEAGLGTRVARIAIAYHVILLLGMVATGVGIGHRVNGMIHQKRSIFRSPSRGSWAEAVMNLWGYELNGDEQVSPFHLEKEPTSMIEPFVLLDLPKRRGRKPTFPLERWLPVALKWENRDPIRDAFTLGELISEHLGTNSDGSPIVSEQTYYSIWRPRAIAELRRRSKSGKTSMRKALSQ